MQLYHLLSIYKIIRPPKFGNCSNSDELQKKQARITLEDFKNCFSENTESYRQQYIKQLQQRIENIIDTDSWEMENVIEISESSELSTEIINLVIYCNCGWICRKMLKKVTCNTCQTAFKSQEENAMYPVADLLNTKNKGKLIYAKMTLFKMLQQIELLFTKYIEDKEIYFKILDDVSANKVSLSFPCGEHKNRIIPELLHDYILIRMLQHTRIIRKEASKTSNNLKKESRTKKS